jgi:beta-glucosidase
VDLGIPRAQEDLMKAVAATGKPTVLVLLNGSAVSINWAAEHVPAIVEAWYPGQAGGAALADVLFGDYNPGGRLPITFYRSADQLPAFDDYSMKNRTYRFFTGQPLFPFGFGLSYTTFSYSGLKQTSDQISVDVQNTGRISGEEVAELYVKKAGAAPIRSLAGFRRVSLGPGERKNLLFPIASLGSGAFEVSVGGGQPGTGSPRLKIMQPDRKLK